MSGPTVIPGASLSSDGMTCTAVTTTIYTTGQIARQVWWSISGSAVSNLTGNSRYPDSPDECSLSTSFEAPSNIGNSYGERMRGFLIPSVSGSYTFWIASNNDGELWLSIDENPANRQRIAYVSGYTNVREWNKYSSQRSASITLNAGQAYYIEALLKEGTNTDNLAVAWQGPGMSGPTVIPGSNLSATGIACP